MTGLVGRRVRLDAPLADLYVDLGLGSEGTIKFVDDTGTLHVEWDDGHKLGIFPDKDRFTIVDDEVER